MSRLTRLFAPVAVAAALALAGQQLLTTSPAQAATETNISGTYSKPLKAAVKDIGVAKEHRSGYDRALFKHWTDDNKNGCNTRYEVLIAEAKKKPTVAAGCWLRGGKWKSYYDGESTRNIRTLEIDHMIPLAESWDSGARSWNADTRQRFANDLKDSRTLAAVTSKQNQSKSDRDPADWMPKHGQCRYIGEWVAVKLRWSLTADAREHAKLTKYAKSCPNKTIKVKKAAVKRGSAPAAGPSSAPAAPGVKLVRVQYDAPGSDSAANTNDEWAEIANTSGIKANLTGWTLTDAAGATYTFGKFTLGPGSTVKIHSGSGSNNSGHVYANWGHTWNNTGDTARLFAADTSPMHSCEYTPNTSGLATCA
jgi:hypothetical protein